MIELSTNIRGNAAVSGGTKREEFKEEEREIEEVSLSEAVRRSLGAAGYEEPIYSDPTEAEVQKI